MLDKCKIIKKETKARKKDVDKLRTSKQSMPRKKAEFLCRISVLEDNTETIGKLSKKETTTFITLAEKVQESLRKPHSRSNSSQN